MAHRKLTHFLNKGTNSAPPSSEQPALTGGVGGSRSPGPSRSSETPSQVEGGLKSCFDFILMGRGEWGLGREGGCWPPCPKPICRWFSGHALGILSNSYFSFSPPLLPFPITTPNPAVSPLFYFVKPLQFEVHITYLSLCFSNLQHQEFPTGSST